MTHFLIDALFDRTTVFLRESDLWILFDFFSPNFCKSYIKDVCIKFCDWINACICSNALNYTQRDSKFVKNFKFAACQFVIMKYEYVNAVTVYIIVQYLYHNKYCFLVQEFMSSLRTIVLSICEWNAQNRSLINVVVCVVWLTYFQMVLCTRARVLCIQCMLWTLWNRNSGDHNSSSIRYLFVRAISEFFLIFLVDFAQTHHDFVFEKREYCETKTDSSSNIICMIYITQSKIYAKYFSKLWSLNSF